MKIKHNAVVSFHYRLCDATTQEELENSHAGNPSVYLHGRRAITPALEAVMTEKDTGDIFSVTLLPEESFGIREEGRHQRVPIKHLMGKVKPKVGMAVSIQTDGGVRQGVVIKIGKFNVDLDTNHPLAGKTVIFDIEIVDVREATQEEIDHGHAHGIGGHQH
ncbi:MAG: peptidylprolyl isomerase [Porticoccus sp.]|jgi:FKBP-type peptidyl-prolyl cis-trans isomerase SlyD|tara:strand:- start:7528 stop:8013 length:486 start_codon:yes stop_codon:yes gene_type:complete